MGGSPVDWTRGVMTATLSYKLCGSPKSASQPLPAWISTGLKVIDELVRKKLIGGGGDVPPTSLWANRNPHTGFLAIVLLASLLRGLAGRKVSKKATFIKFALRNCLKFSMELTNAITLAI